MDWHTPGLATFIERVETMDVRSSAGPTGLNRMKPDEAHELLGSEELAHADR